MTRSLQSRLSMMLVSTLLVAALVAAAVAFFLAYGEAKEFQDDMLRQIALVAADSKGAEPTSATARTNVGRLEDSESRVTIMRFPTEPRPAWLTIDLPPGFQTVEAGDSRYRLFVQPQGLDRILVVSQLTDARDEIALHSAWRTLLPLLLLMPVLAALVIYIVRHELRSIGRLGHELDQQSVARPSTLADHEVPDEIKPFVAAINRLLVRVRELMEQERRFIADAAHELRSPLTALLLQAQNIKRAESLPDMQQRIVPLLAGVERARALTEQLLGLARVQTSSIDITSMDAATLVDELVAESEPAATAKGIDIGTMVHGSTILETSPILLRLVLKNALDNAIKYSPERGKVDIHVNNDGNAVVFEIADNGPGIPVEEREQVFKPFHRAGDGFEEGSGLGLSIAREAATALGGSIDLLNRQHQTGLVFRFSLPVTVVAK